jgi:hypothetical protein
VQSARASPPLPRVSLRKECAKNARNDDPSIRILARGPIITTESAGKSATRGLEGERERTVSQLRDQFASGEARAS